MKAATNRNPRRIGRQLAPRPSALITEPAQHPVPTGNRPSPEPRADTWTEPRPTPSSHPFLFLSPQAMLYSDPASSQRVQLPSIIFHPHLATATPDPNPQCGRRPSRRCARRSRRRCACRWVYSLSPTWRRSATTGPWASCGCASGGRSRTPSARSGARSCTPPRSPPSSRIAGCGA
jgi:hypothetical protein